MEPVVDSINSSPALKQLIKMSASKAERINYPMDKVNRKIWENLDYIDHEFKVGENKKGNISIIVSVDFKNLKDVSISKTLTMFDKRVYIAASALFNAGNEIVTLTQIYHAMGNVGKPAKFQLKKINDALTKMSGAEISVDNSTEFESKYKKYGKFIYRGSLLPIERVSAVVNGQLTDAAVHFFREPPLLTFAMQRKQVTTFNAELLQSSLNKTENNLAIEDYLLERISSTKAAAASKEKKLVINEILLETLYRETGITKRFQKSRAIEKIKIYLNYYVKCGYISFYEMKPDRIIFCFK